MKSLISHFSVSLFFLFICSVVFAQQDSLKTTYQIFRYEDGTISSEGKMLNGIPEGLWKTYYPSGQLKTEGSRSNFELDGEWKFFREDGSIEKSIEYKFGKKDGLQRVFSEAGVLLEKIPFQAGIENGGAEFYYKSGELYREVPFIEGKEEGNGKEFGKDGSIITLLNYEKGFIRSIERINRYNSQQQKKGVWIEFWPNGNRKTEGYYTKGIKNGIFKYYNSKGELQKIEKYQGGQLLTDADEAQLLDIRKEYFESGKLKLVGSYKNGSKQGTFREYDEEGNVIQSYVYKENLLLGEGIVDDEGRRQGDWKIYYPTGEIQAEGAYVDGLREGPWVFYHAEGKIAQKGAYRLDLPQGEWRWYFKNGEIHREEYYRKGKEDGEFVEYNEKGEVIHKGAYIDGYKTGEWYYFVNDHKEEGAYLDGEKDGKWKFTYLNGKKNFEGEYQIGVPIGKHKYYYENGVMKEEGSYEAGEKHGKWKFYDEAGLLILSIKYNFGKTEKIDGSKVLIEGKDGDE
ncbi:MAG: hypothetical protein NWQ53_01830 [Flavobacteriales bacterium]|nr:hypothetical protein [Flavobacteriales bacterium]